MMAEDEPQIVRYPLAEIVLDTSEGTVTYIALNEFTLKGVDNTLVAQIDINDELFEMFRGDGIVVSTPSGSTAYNKSLGGAVIHPSIESLADCRDRVHQQPGLPDAGLLGRAAAASSLRHHFREGSAAAADVRPSEHYAESIFAPSGAASPHAKSASPAIGRSRSGTGCAKRSLATK